MFDLNLSTRDRILAFVASLDEPSPELVAAFREAEQAVNVARERSLVEDIPA